MHRLHGIQVHVRETAHETSGLLWSTLCGHPCQSIIPVIQEWSVWDLFYGNDDDDDGDADDDNFVVVVDEIASATSAAQYVSILHTAEISDILSQIAWYSAFAP